MIRLAIIGGGYMASIFAEKAKEMNIETHCFSPRSGIKKPESFDCIHDVNILDKEKVVFECRKLEINGVVATTELTISVAAYVANALHLNGISSDISNKITDKYRNRKSVEEVDGLFHPRYCIVSSVNDILNSGLKYPMILKPTSKGGKRGITVINSMKNVAEAFEYAISDGGKGQPLILEEYINGGMECSVESLSFHGTNYIIQVTEKITSGPPHCVELAHHQPARLNPTLRKRIEKIMCKALTFVGLTNGACHTEIKIKDDRIYLIEFNARPGGDHIASPLTQLSTGFDYIKGAILIALDINPNINLESFEKKYSGVVFITEQTKEYKPIFDVCQNYSWCYKKNVISSDLKTIQHNDGFNTNYFIYCGSERPTFLKQ